MLISIDQPKFNELLSSSIVAGLREIGENLPKVIFYHIWLKKGLREDELATNIGIFADGLAEIFGEGSKVIEREILTKLNSRIGFLEASKGDVPLRDCARLYEFWVSSRQR